MKTRVEKCRMWLAQLFYGWACRLARQDLNRPWDPAAPGEFGRLQAARSERAAREWKERYRQLKKKQLDPRLRTTTVF